MLTPRQKSKADALSGQVAPRASAAETQAANADRVEALLRDLLERVPGMRSPTGEVHWGHVGSSNEVVRLLEQAAGHA